MPIGRPSGVRIELEKTTPDAFTSETLKAQLNSIGLTCDQTHVDNLQRHLDEVRASMSNQKNESYLIAKPGQLPTGRLSARSPLAARWAAVDTLGEENTSARHFLHHLISNDPAQKHFVSRITANDPVAQDFIAQLRGEHKRTRLGTDGVDFTDFHAELGNTGQDPTRLRTLAAQADSVALSLVAALSTNHLRGTAVGNWTVGGKEYACGYATEFGSIINPDNFARLKQDFPTEFDGNYANPSPLTGNDTSVDAVRNMFCRIGYIASQALVEGLSAADTEAVFTNIIKPYNTAHNYSDKGPEAGRVVYVCSGYHRVTDPRTGENYGEADVVGVMAVNWDVEITDYRNKKHAKHETSVSVKSRAVVYTDAALITKHYNHVAR